MNNEQAKRTLSALEKISKKKLTKKEARKFLEKAGILTKSGNLSTHYK